MILPRRSTFKGKGELLLTRGHIHFGDNVIQRVPGNTGLCLQIHARIIKETQDFASNGSFPFTGHALAVFPKIQICTATKSPDLRRNEKFPSAGNPSHAFLNTGAPQKRTRSWAQRRFPIFGGRLGRVS